MESFSAREQLAAAERGAAAPYITYPRTPWWYAPLVGAWTAAMIGTFLWWRVNAVLFTVALVVLVAAENLFVIWLRRRHGAFPLLGKGTPPAEIAALRRRFGAGLAVVAVVVAAVWWLAGIPAAAGVAFVLVTAGLAYYERRYAAAAARIRARLS
jgi:hypothetical protein